MPDRSSCTCRDRIWVALYNASDAITSSANWPAVPGSECWAYEAAVRVANYVCSCPRYVGLPFDDMLRHALLIHRSLAWRTAMGRRARLAGRYVCLDGLEDDRQPSVRDRYGLEELSEAAVASSLLALGVPAIRASAAAARICRDLDWDEIRADLIRQFGAAPSAASLRTYFGRDMRRHGLELARRLGLVQAA